jgi:hypothetical protein
MILGCLTTNLSDLPAPAVVDLKTPQIFPKDPLCEVILAPDSEREDGYLKTISYSMTSDRIFVEKKFIYISLKR